MARKLGTSAALIAKLGDDGFGNEYFQSLQENGIICDHVTYEAGFQTSTANIIVTDEGQNSIVYVPGAIMQLKKEDIQAAENIIMNAKVVLCTYECPLDTLLTALKLAKKHNVMTVVNAAPAANSSYEVIYKYTDILCINEIEAEEATGVPIKNIDDAVSAIEILQDKNCCAVIVTLGSQGAVYQKLGQEFAHVPAKEVKAVDSTGAGDAFMGSLAYYLANYPNLNLKTAIKRACDIATFSVLEKGTQSSFPSKGSLPESLFL